jgi:hypothetical protein
MNVPWCAMPFSNLQLDPDHIEAMHDAFQRVCDIPAVIM